MKRRTTDSNTEGKKDTGMLKYIRTQVLPFRVFTLLNKLSFNKALKFHPNPTDARPAMIKQQQQQQNTFS